MALWIFLLKKYYWYEKFKSCFSRKNLELKKKNFKKMWFHFGRVIGEYPHLHKIKIKKNKNYKDSWNKKFTGSIKK